MKKLVTLILTIITSLSINAQWSNTTNIFNDGLHMPVCTEVGNQNNSIVINSYPDGGYFLIWEDKRSGPLYHIYAQKYDKEDRKSVV